MNADNTQEAMREVLFEALSRKQGGAPETYSTERSWVQNGGSSLDAYAAVMRIEEELGVIVPVARLLGAAPLSALIEQAALPAAPAQEAAAPEGAVPATATQRRHWRHAQGAGSAAFLNIGKALRCGGDFDADRAEHAFRALVARHESLRNRFVSTPDGLFLDEVTDWPERAEFVRHPEAADAEAAALPVREAMGRTFPLAQEPPVRGGCVPLADGTALVYFAVHHIAADGWTIDLLTDDFLTLYTKGEGALAAATPFSRYASALDGAARSGVHADDIAYWEKKFARVSPDFTVARREATGASGQRAGTLRLVWDGPGEAAAVREKARALGVTTYSLLLSGLLATARVLSGEDHVVVMSGVANRNRAEYRTTAGLFTNQIFFVGDFTAPARSADDYVREVHADVVESLERSQLPVEVVLDGMGAYDTARTLAPYANILFQAAEAPIESSAMSDGGWRPFGLGSGSIKRHCNIHLEDDGGAGLALELDYSLALVGRHQAERLLSAVRAVTDAIVAGRVDAVPELLAVAEDAAGEPAPVLTVHTVDYPGARAEPALAAFVREILPEADVVELPVPMRPDAAEIEECLRRGHDALGRSADGPAVVLGYCSAASWARHLIATLPDGAAAPALLSVNGTALTEADWYEEFGTLLLRAAPDADVAALTAAAPALPPGADLNGRLEAARDVLVLMRGHLESAMERRFGSPLGRVARETLDVQQRWLGYLGSCVALESPADSVEERGLPGVRLDQGPRIGQWLRAELEASGAVL
ncbi:condensation domain-containing protein [Streptomyces sp. NPDC052299]|uniref:condensation domain-containing protein n=1 Tax=Streptomyces sp. NPDC052299 TaxID=3155054 RepID=UPI0034455AD9